VTGKNQYLKYQAFLYPGKEDQFFAIQIEKAIAMDLQICQLISGKEFY
jgi:hypothetical protein